MADSKLTFLTEVELPPYCFMSEAIEWIALGRVPQMQHEVELNTEEIIDSRFYWREMPDNFRPRFYYPWYDLLEFESIGIPINNAYFDAAEKCFSECVNNLPAKIAEYEAKDAHIIEREDGTTFDLYTSMASDARAKLVELGPLQEIVDQVEAQFRPYIDVSCAKLFQLLAMGQITCQALPFKRWEHRYDEGECQEAARFDDVPATALSLGIDWMKNEIEIDGEQHVSLRVRTHDILDHRSILLQSGKPLSVERFGASYMSSNTGRTNRRAKVGRRSVIDWRLLAGRLSEMAKAGIIPDGKENCIYELISFAESELGKGPSRTAVQRNLGPELDALYAQN